MFHDQKAVSLSPSKGKAKEDDHWNVGWWEFHSLVEQPRRPIEWSDVSVIFTAHPTQPLITGRHFSSSKHFVIPAPLPKLSPPPVYASPTVITCSPGSEWLFAYFPGHDGDGVACIWKRGPQIDVWIQKHAWIVSRGLGVVTALWLGGPRAWTTDITGYPTRLPPRGPRTPVSNPTLVTVTQDRRIHIWYLRTLAQSFRSISYPLIQSGTVNESQPSVASDPVTGPDGVQLCTHAAIGLAHNEHSILVATRSCNYPIPTPEADSASIDLNISIGLPPVAFPDCRQDWTSWGEKAVVEIAEVQLLFNGAFMTLAVIPLPPLYYPSSGLTQLTFICTPPNVPLDSSKSPTMTRKDNMRGNIHLAVSYLDFAEYTSTPKSSLTLHRFIRNSGGLPHWKTQLVASRAFESSVLAFILPKSVLSGSDQPGFYAGVLDTYGSTVHRKTNATAEASIGSIRVLKLSDLGDHEYWDNSSLICPLERLGRELPLNAAISPNQALLATVTSGLGSTATAIHSLPTKSLNVMKTDDDAALQHETLSLGLASAILSRRSTDDVTQTLALHSTTLTTAINVINQAHTILEDLLKGLTDSETWEILGQLIEIYRLRSESADTDEERNSCRARWGTAHDMVSLAACNKGFQLCSEGDLYDLSAVWQLIAMSTWVVNFIEKVMKECVLSYDITDTEIVKSGDVSKPTSNPSSGLPDSPILLHLVHPYALTNLCDGVHHVKHFHKHLGSTSARGENALIAKNVLSDLVNCCGVDLDALELLLSEVIQDAKILPGDEVRRSLDACQPSQALYGYIRKTLQRINTSSVLNKSQLFLKPTDLVDGVARLSFESHKKHEERDVVSKGLLPERSIGFSCVRCRGKTAVLVNDNQVTGRPPRWRLWEKAWEKHCICWGSWSLG